MIKVTGKQHWNNHIVKRHAPIRMHHAPIRVAPTSGARGAKAQAQPAPMSQHAWFQRAKDAGKAKAKEVAEREEVLARNSQVDEEDAAPVPPPPAPFLPPPRVQRVVTVAPPQAPLTEPARNESLVVLLQRRIDEYRGDLLSFDPPPALRYVCPGYSIELPIPVAMNYPHALGTLHLTSSIWAAPGWSSPDEEGNVRALEPMRCLGFTDAQDKPCDNCELLKGDTRLQSVILRAWDRSIHFGTTNDVYLTMNQQALRLKHRRTLFCNLELALMPLRSKLRRLLKLPGIVDRITTALASGNIARLHVVMRRLRKRNATPSSVAKMIERAAAGYVPKGDQEREDFQKAFLLSALGGQRALRIAMVVHGAPSKRDTMRTKLFDVPRHYTTIGPLLVDQEHATRELIYHVRIFKAAHEATPTDIAAWHFQFDNVGNDERLRYSTHATFGGVQCIARESTFNGSTQIRCYNDFLRIKQSVEDGEILITKETTVLIAIRNTKQPFILPLFSSGTAKLRGYGKGAQDQAFMVQQVRVWQYCRRHEYGSVRMLRLRARARVRVCVGQYGC